MPALFTATPAMAPLVVHPQPVSSFTPVVKGNPHNFAYEVPSTSLGDLEIARKIVEREGCIEALQHLIKGSITATGDPAKSDNITQSSNQPNELEVVTGYCYAGPRSIRSGRPSMSAVAGGTPAVAPPVLQSVLDQLRVVGIQIVEMITKWRRSTSGAQTYQWRGLNYLHKMTTDLNFLASITTTFESLRAIRLEHNPLLSPLHLDHHLLRREVQREGITPEMITQLQQLLPDGVSNGIGIDRIRIFEASKVLAGELMSERRRGHLQNLADQFACSTEGNHDDRENDELESPSSGAPKSTTRRVHWSHRPVTFPFQTSHASANVNEINEEVTVARELLVQAEYELGALREQIAKIQQQLREEEEGLVPPLPPDKRRRLKTRISSMTNDLKFRSGDVFQRRNELRRRENAVAHLTASIKKPLKQKQTQPSIAGQQNTQGNLLIRDDEAQICSTLESWSLVGLDNPALLEAALQQDELRRHEIVNKFTAEKTAASTAVRQRAGSAPAVARRSATGNKGGIQPAIKHPAELTSGAVQITQMNVDDVLQFIDSLALGIVPGMATIADASSSQLTFGGLFKAQGIDGSMLATATDRNLEELGVYLRLHRIRILQAVQVHGMSRLKQSKSKAEKN